MSGPPAWVWAEDDEDLDDDRPSDADDDREDDPEGEASPDATPTNDPPPDGLQESDARVAAAVPDHHAAAALDQDAAPPGDMHALAARIETLATAQGPHAAVPTARDAADPDDDPRS